MWHIRSMIQPYWHETSIDSFKWYFVLLCWNLWAFHSAQEFVIRMRVMLAVLTSIVTCVRLREMSDMSDEF